MKRVGKSEGRNFTSPIQISNQYVAEPSRVSSFPDCAFYLQPGILYILCSCHSVKIYDGKGHYVNILPLPVSAMEMFCLIIWSTVRREPDAFNCCLVSLLKPPWLRPSLLLHFYDTYLLQVHNHEAWIQYCMSHSVRVPQRDTLDF
jgi:hypothetical protein